MGKNREIIEQLNFWPWMWMELYSMITEKSARRLLMQ